MLIHLPLTKTRVESMLPITVLKKIRKRQGELDAKKDAQAEAAEETEGKLYGAGIDDTI